MGKKSRLHGKAEAQSERIDLIETMLTEHAEHGHQRGEIGGFPTSLLTVAPGVFWSPRQPVEPKPNPAPPAGAAFVEGGKCTRVTIHASGRSEIWVRLTRGSANVERPGQQLIGPLQRGTSIKASGDVVIHSRGNMKVYYRPV